MRRRDPLANPERLIRRVYSYVAYRLGDGPEAEDVTSAVFERAVRYRGTYDASKGEPIAWLLGIARRSVDAAFAPHPLPMEEVPDQPSPDDVEERTVTKLTLVAAVNRLEPRDQELIALRYGADLTAAQIGEVLEMRTNTVEVALHRSLERLRTLLDPAEHSALPQSSVRIEPLPAVSRKETT
jgi:RNA polymerase sigma-70 factor (ECF subfamily)